MSEHGETGKASAAGHLRRISELLLELSGEFGALGRTREIQLAAGAEQSVHADMPETAAQEDLLTTKQLCAMLHLHARTVRRMELLEELPSPIRTAGRKRWPRATIEAWLAQREESSK